MTNEFRAVKDFMREMDQDVPDTPRYPQPEVISLRIDLIEEEVTELLETLYRVRAKLQTGGFVEQGEKLRNLVRIADDVADVVYVVNGTAAAFGINGERVFEIVHAANMKKAGGPILPSGKRSKPEGWQPPEPAIADVITSAWASHVPEPVAQGYGVIWEGDGSV